MSPAAIYDFDAMRLNVAAAKRAFDGDRHALSQAFDHSQTPQGHDWWAERYYGGIDDEARAVLAFMISQSLQFEIAGGQFAA